jgi:hypothetical protein
MSSGKNEKMQEYYKIGIEKMIGSLDGFKAFSKTYGAIAEIDSLNRIAIFAQDDTIRNVFPEVDWVMAGRRVKEAAVGIQILVPVTRTIYTYSESGENIGLHDLSPEELRQATQLGVITKHSEVISSRVVNLFDISETVLVDPPLYDEYLKTTKLNEIDTRALKKLASFLDIKVEPCIVSSYIDEDRRILFAADTSEKILQREIISAISTMAVVDALNSEGIADSTLVEAFKQGAKAAVEIYLKSFLLADLEYSVAAFNSIKSGLEAESTERSVVELVKLIDVAILKVNEAIKMVLLPISTEKHSGETLGLTNSGTSRRIEILSKANKLLSRIESCAIRHRIKL